MSRNLHCPHCQTPFRPPADLPAGGVVLCPGCKKRIRLPAASPPTPVHRAPPVAELVEDVVEVQPVEPVIELESIPEHLLPPGAAVVRKPATPPAAPPRPAKPAAPPQAIAPARHDVPVLAQPVEAGPRGAPRHPAPASRFTSEPAATPRRLTNHAAIVTAVIAALAALGWMASLLGLVGHSVGTSAAAWLTLILLASLFGGMVGSSLTGVARFRHSLYAGLWLSGVLFAVVVPFAILFQWYAWQLAGRDTDEALEALEHLLGTVALCMLLSPFLIVAGFLIGGAVDVAATALLRGIVPRERWTYHTHDGKSFPVYGPWRNPLLAAFWNVSGWSLLCTCWVPLVFGGGPETLLAAWALGQVCRRLARKHSAVSAKAALETDHRPPIVYLRSFQDDGLFNPGVVLLANDWLRTLGEKTAEDNLSGLLAPFGPVVAIGRPEEEMPEVGAARIYVGDDHWQDLITDLLSNRGALAVFQAGGTRGLRWELETTASLLRPEQILMFLPFGLHRLPRRRDAGYAAFRAWAGECFPAPFPETIAAREFFFYFTARPAWKTRVVRPGATVPEAHPLAEVLTDLQKGQGLQPWRLFNLRRLVLLMVLGLLLWPVSYGFGALRKWMAGSTPAPAAAAPAPQGKAPAAVTPAVAPAAPPRPENGTRYEGKALPYHITLGPEWQREDAEDKQDAAFRRGESIDLVVLVSAKEEDVTDASSDYVAGLRKAKAPGRKPKFGEVTLLQDRKVRVNGKEWTDFKVELAVGDTKVWQHVRCYSGDEGTFFLLATLRDSDPDVEKELTAALDSFELPSR